MRQFTVKILAGVIMFGTVCSWEHSYAAATDRGVSVRELSCEYVRNPLGIDTPQPRFSWILKSEERGQMQSAYRILVASSADNLDSDMGDKWDSGKIDSGQSVNVDYQGSALKSGKKCWWKVRVWDKNGQISSYSETATFEMGLLKQNDWQGQWIGADASISSPLLRKEFGIAKKIKRARAYFCGLGFGELYFNGRKVSNEVLTPAFTDYFKEVSYLTYDVTDQLRTGKNVLGIMLGNGWYSAPILDWKRPWAKCPQALLQLNIEYTDGTNQSFYTDDSWKTAAGSISRNDINFGEHYDARQEKPQWNTVGYDDNNWNQVMIVVSPTGRLVCQTMPGMKVMKTLCPIKITNPKENVWVFEFDRLFGGWTRLHVKGKKGTKITLEYSSRILDNGLIDKRPWPGEQETDIYILKGAPEGEVFEPRFTFHPVQYVQVTGLPEPPTASSLEGRVVYNDVDLYGDFRCSNELFNSIHANVIQTLENALKGFILDCMHREPFGYSEPASISASLWTRKHMPTLWNKFARDVLISAHPKGFVSDVVPNFPGMVRKPDVSQITNYPMMLWYLYQTYADKQLLEDHYQAVKNWVDYIATMSDNLIVKKGWLGDHMLPGHSPGYEKWRSDETPPELIWTCFYYHNAHTVAKIAGVLGYLEDQQRYRQLADNIKVVINNTWLDKDTCDYSTGSQTSKVLPLAIGIVPDEYKQGLINNLAKTITETDDNKLRVGHAGLPGFIESLTNNGLGEVFYGIVNQKTYPGWGYMVDQGATTIWECWGRDWAPILKNKRKHRTDSMTMLAGIVNFFYDDLAGLEGPDFYGDSYFAPGYKQIIIKPHVLGDIIFARGSIKTVRGIISSSWEKSDNAIKLSVVIPVNSEAKVSVPKIGLKRIMITENDKPVWKKGEFIKGVPGITAGTETDDYVTFDAGSGNYTFRLNGGR